MSLIFTQVLCDRWICYVVPVFSQHTPKRQLVCVWHSPTCSTLTMINNNKSSTGLGWATPVEIVMLKQSHVFQNHIKVFREKKKYN